MYQNEECAVFLNMNILSDIISAIVCIDQSPRGLTFCLPAPEEVSSHVNMLLKSKKVAHNSRMPFFPGRLKGSSLVGHRGV